MKKPLAALLVLFINCSLHGQDYNTMAGDWIRVKAEYVDGQKLPNNHGARLFLRYHFTKKEVYQVFTGNTVASTYTRTGNALKIEPIQVYVIEAYTDKVLTLVDADGPDPIRYHLIPTDSFQVSGRLKYPYEVIDADTIYTDTPGIEPIYPKGNRVFMNDIMTGISQSAGFNFTFVVQKDGTIGNVTIKASSNPKSDKRLIQLVKKTSGKWIPATYKGKPINVRQACVISLNSSG